MLRYEEDNELGRNFFLNFLYQIYKNLFINGIPFLTIFFSAWMGLIQIPGLSFITPDYGSCAVFFWCLYRPDLIPLGLLAGTGVMVDCIGGGFLGQTSLLWFLVYFLSLPQRRILTKTSFSLIWVAFGLVFLITSVVITILFWILRGVPPLFLSWFVHFILTVGVYPFVCLGLSRFQNMLGPSA